MNGGTSMEFLTTKEISEQWDISVRRLAILCEDGRLPGAIKKGKIWLIPSSTEKLERKIQENERIL